METKANTTLIGAFIIGIVAGLFAFVMWVSRATEGRNTVSYDVMFDGSVSGLVKGSAVLFNGIRVGAVTDMRLNPTDPRQVIARVSLEPKTPIRTDSRVTLEYQGITGSASISIRGGVSSAPIIPAENGRVPILFAETSAVQDLMQAGRNIMGRADSVMERLDKLVIDNQAPISNSVKNVEKFSGALGDNSESISTFLKDTGEAAKKIAILTEKADKVAAKLDLLLENIDGKRIQSTLNNIDIFTAGMAAQTLNLAAFIQDARSVSKTLETTLNDVSALTKAIDAKKLNESLNNIESFTAVLGKSAPKVDELFADAANVAKKLSATADTAEKFIKNFDPNAQGGLMSEFSETAKSIRTLSERLDKRVGEMSSGINNFTSRGIRDVESLVTDSRRALGQIERSLKTLESNPQRLLFGGSGVPEYNRR